MKVDSLPDAPLRGAGPLAQAFRACGCDSYRSAARLVASLPYGRTSNRADWRLVLTEHCGTCSTKHALLAAMAQELSLPVHLVLGAYAMTEQNTPGVGAILAPYGLTEILEAHCWLESGVECVDLTFPLVSDPAPRTYIEAHRIEPDQIGDYKEAFHHRVLDQWRVRGQISWSHRQLWSIRNSCMEALAESR